MNLDTSYSYQSITEGGVDLKHHWNNTAVKEALNKKHDFVIIQPKTSDILKDIINNPNTHPTDFYQFGAALLGKAKEKTAIVGLYQTWIPIFHQPLDLLEQYVPAVQLFNQYVNEFYDNKKFGQIERDYWHYTQSNHYAKLANQTYTNLIPVAKSWHKAEKECPNISLFGSDQYHASIHGAYLIALTIVRFINDNKIIPDAIFVPDTLSSEDAKCLVRVVNSNV